MSGGGVIDDKALRRIGRELFKGAWQYLCTIVLVTLLLLAALGWALGDFERDDTDSSSARSGMKLRTDFGTGCQYLETSEGAITPRMGIDGKQVCQ